MNAQLVLRHPYGQEPISQFWSCQIVDNKVIINRQDLEKALYQSSGLGGRFDRINPHFRLELQTMTGEPLRTSEQLQKAYPAPPPP